MSLGSAACPRLSKPDAKGVFVLHLGSDENRITLKTMQKLHEHLDRIVLKRLLSLPVPLIACINGHAFGGGAMVALCCDYRVMNSARGFLCLNEIHIGLPLTPGMCAVVSAKIVRSSWTWTLLAGKRWSADDAATIRVVDEAVRGEAEAVNAALQLAAAQAALGENRSVYGAIKRQLYERELRALDAGLGAAAALVSSLRSGAASGVSRL
ncbi:putative enoyl- hydratase isomerase [Cystoisospora suis]|uniref:Putative enoyl-hydratase isomerase n=1 Tax=Cystoisospora suis TaxID=483139 RepID=A0A2C6L0L2_9APIC|nr:putative enoyl- hydratase isomerase [Cystoisospora suis]